MARIIIPNMADEETGPEAPGEESAPPRPARPYSYGTRDVQPGYEQTLSLPPQVDPEKSTRYDSPPPDPADDPGWGEER
jgi:hypothetical protein